MSFKERIIKILRWSEKYTKTDMVYLAKGGFWQTFGKVITFLIGFATLSVLSRWLSKETFGAYRYVLSITEILGLTTLPGLGSALNRAISKGREGMLIEVTKEKVKWSSLGILASLAVSGWYLIQGNALLGYSFLMASFLFPLPRIFNVYTPFWQGRKRFDLEAQQTMLINLMEALVFLPVVYFFNNLLVIFSAYFTSRVIFRGIIFKYALNRTENNKRDKETLSYGKHLTVMGVVNSIANKIDKVIIWQFLGPVQVAIYSFAKLPVTKVEAFLPIKTLTLPKLSEKRVKKIKKPLLKKFTKLFIVSISAAVAYYFAAPYFYKLLFPQYIQAVPFAQALSLLIALTPFSLLDTSLVAEMKKRELYFIRVATPLLKIILFLILVPFYGIWGIITALLFTQVLNGLLAYYFFKRI